MARYDYKCPGGHINEVSFPIGEAPKTIGCPEREDVHPELDECPEGATRMLATHTSFMINKVMSPPSKRLKPQHLGKA
jgi:hypothetical protein